MLQETKNKAELLNYGYTVKRFNAAIVTITTTVLIENNNKKKQQQQQQQNESCFLKACFVVK